jgi:hypothetical protein
MSNLPECVRTSTVGAQSSVQILGGSVRARTGSVVIPLPDRVGEADMHFKAVVVSASVEIEGAAGSSSSAPTIRIAAA